MGQTRQDDTRTELSRPGEPGLTTRIVEKGIQKQHVAERISSRNNIFKALVDTSWGQQKEILLSTDDLQGSRKIDQLRCTCLESKPTQHQP